jgi:hypothetical protein
VIRAQVQVLPVSPFFAFCFWGGRQARYRYFAENQGNMRVVFV